MKLLIISRSPWDDSNSFGNTFSNLFGGIDDLAIYNICCQDGVNNNNVVRKAFQMTDRSVLNTLKGQKAGHIMDGTSNRQDNSSSMTAKLPKRRYTIFYIARDLIWSIGHWWDNGLRAFLNDVKPDIIYLPIYASWYMCNVQRKIVDYCKTPVVGHITDDLYNYPPHPLHQPLAYLYRTIIRKKVRKLIAECSYVEVFAENMASEYSATFKKPFYIIGKGIDKKNIDELNIKQPSDNPIIYVYTGNIGNDRYLELAKLGLALDKAYPNGEAELHVYTKSLIDDCMQKALIGNKSLQLRGAVSSDEVKTIQQKADVLVHVEGFSDQSIFETKMSFSTKLIDYMLAGKIIFAIGPSEINSIQVLNNYELAVCAFNDESIQMQVEAIKNGKIDVCKLTQSVKTYLQEHRDIKKIQSEMYSRLKSIKGE